MVHGTRRQLQALEAVIHHGDHKAAAHALGISDRALEDRLQALRARNGDASTIQLAWRHGRADLQLPAWLDAEFALA